MREYLQTRHLNIDEFFDCYWKRNQEEFLRSTASRHWEGSDPHDTHLEDVEASDREAERERVVTVELARLSEYSMSKSLHDQAFHMVESFGPTAVKK